MSEIWVELWLQNIFLGKRQVQADQAELSLESAGAKYVWWSCYCFAHLLIFQWCVKQIWRIICFFIGPKSDHCLLLSLTDSRLVNLIDVTLAFEDDNSKHVEVVTVDDVDDEDRVGNSLL